MATGRMTVAVEFQDAEGERAITEFQGLIEDTSNVSVANILAMQTAVLAAFNPITNAAVYSIAFNFKTYQDLVVPSEIAGYSDIEDKLFMVTQASDGSLGKFNIPAPTTGAFLADEETINPVGGGVVDSLLQYLITDLAVGTTIIKFITNTGTQMAVLAKGYRRRAKTRRKLRQGIPTETGG